MMLFPSARLLRQAGATIFRQQQHITRLEHEVRVAELQYMRIARDLMEQFLIALDHPEDHYLFSERLNESLAFYRDEIAVREEHA